MILAGTNHPSGRNLSSIEWLDAHEQAKSSFRDQIVSRWQLPTGADVIDLGCGPGFWVRRIAAAVGTSERRSSAKGRGAIQGSGDIPLRSAATESGTDRSNIRVPGRSRRDPVAPGVRADTRLGDTAGPRAPGPANCGWPINRRHTMGSGHIPLDFRRKPRVCRCRVGGSP